MRAYVRVRVCAQARGAETGFRHARAAHVIKCFGLLAGFGGGGTVPKDHGNTCLGLLLPLHRQRRCPGHKRHD